MTPAVKANGTKLLVPEVRVKHSTGVEIIDKTLETLNLELVMFEDVITYRLTGFQLELTKVQKDCISRLVIN